MKNKTSQSSVLKKAIESIDPLIKQKVDNRMYLAATIQDLLINKGLKKIDFAKMVGKRPSEITKWLSGSHNFTVDTLTEIGVALETNLIIQSKRPTPRQTINVVFQVTRKVEASSFSYVSNLRKVATKEYTA